MDVPRRSFLALFSMALPILAATPVARALADPLPQGDDLWDALHKIKTLPTPEGLAEARKLHQKEMQLAGYVHDVSGLAGSDQKRLLSRRPVSCCVECLLHGAEPVVFLPDRYPAFGNQKQIAVAGRISLIENEALSPHFRFA